MKRVIIGLYCVIGVFLSGCDKTDDYVSFFKNYIRQYVAAKELRLIEGMDQQGIAILFEGTRYHASSAAIIPDTEDGASLSEYFGDVSFNRKISRLELYGTYLADEFTAIEITSDRDFDATHPAGTSLGDIVMFYGASADPFIVSGYNESVVKANREALLSEFERKYDHGQYADFLIKKPVNEVTATDLRLLTSQAFLKFTVPPPAGKHTFTVTFRSAEKTLTSTLAVEIE